MENTALESKGLHFLINFNIVLHLSINKGGLLYFFKGSYEFCVIEIKYFLEVIHSSAWDIQETLASVHSSLSIGLTL